jgi:hypothetical protein
MAETTEKPQSKDKGRTPVDTDAPGAGYKLRRAVTVDENATSRRRSTLTLNPEDSFPRPRRRSSNFSDYSQDPRDLFNPAPFPDDDALLAQAPKPSKWESLPLAFALLPAVGGILFQGGSAFVTDLLLLGLCAVFLRWSVTQPW